MQDLTFGSCSNMTGIEVSSSCMTNLDVRGCGSLEQLYLDCPSLRVLDATFCGSLGDAGLAGALVNKPPLRKLALSVCCKVSMPKKPHIAAVAAVRWRSC